MAIRLDHGTDGGGYVNSEQEAEHLIYLAARYWPFDWRYVSPCNGPRGEVRGLGAVRLTEAAHGEFEAR